MNRYGSTPYFIYPSLIYFDEQRIDLLTQRVFSYQTCSLSLSLFLSFSFCLHEKEMFVKISTVTLSTFSSVNEQREKSYRFTSQAQEDAFNGMICLFSLLCLYRQR